MEHCFRCCGTQRLNYQGQQGRYAECGERAMPTYQYRCEKCGKLFEQTEHVAQHAAQHACPQCGSTAVAHQPTRFVAMTPKKS